MGCLTEPALTANPTCLAVHYPQVQFTVLEMDGGSNKRVPDEWIPRTSKQLQKLGTTLLTDLNL